MSFIAILPDDLIPDIDGKKVKSNIIRIQACILLL